MSEEIFYNFNKERVGVMILGAYIIVKKPLYMFLINHFYIFGIVSICVFIISMGAYTVILTVNDKMLAVQASKTIFMLVVSVGVPVVRFATNDSLLDALGMLKTGLYSYEDGDMEQERMNIKKKRMEQIKFFVKLITLMLSFNVTSNAIILPILQFMTATDIPQDSVFAPFLPLPIHLPFQTSTAFGFAVGCMTVALALFFMNVTYTCHEEVYISSSLEVCAQLEILTHSLINIERRAHYKLRMKYCTNAQDAAGNLYEREDFQKCLYLCLLENIKHHQLILRYIKAMKPYIEMTTSIASLSISLLLACELILLAENPGKNIPLVVMLMSEMASYLQISWVGQMITDKSIETKESLYATPWILCNKKFNVLLSVMISNMQEPIVVKSRGIKIPVSLKTFGNMITLGYKIMNVLRETVD